MVPDLIVLGNLIVDDIVLPDGTTRMAQPGGAVIYAALGASLWGHASALSAVSATTIPTRCSTPCARAGSTCRVSGRSVGRGCVRGSYMSGSTAAWSTISDRRLTRRRHPASTMCRRVVARSGRPREPGTVAEQRRLISALARSGVARLAIDPHTPVTDETIDAWRTVFAEVQHFFVSESELQLSGWDQPRRTYRHDSEAASSARSR